MISAHWERKVRVMARITVSVRQYQAVDDRSLTLCVLEMFINV